MKAIRNLREMTRLLDTDNRLRRLCLIKPNEAGYPRSALSRFSRKIGEDNFNKIIDQKVISLLKSCQTKEVDAVLDASFIKAWSTRDPTDVGVESAIEVDYLALPNPIDFGAFWFPEYLDDQNRQNLRLRLQTSPVD